jgi:membrane-associated phospholipid phosphatase
MMKSTLIIYSYLTLILAALSYWYFDLPIALYFQANLYDGVYDFFRLITESGEGLYWIVPTALAYWFYRFFPLRYLPFSSWFIKNREEDMRIMGFVALSAFLSGLLVNILKLIFARYRPVEYFESQNYGLTWFNHGYDIASFPSGHSATALGVAAAVALLFPRYRYPVLFYGALVTFSRVVVTKHYLSDVLIGGYIGVLVSVYLYTRYFKPDNTSASRY